MSNTNEFLIKKLEEQYGNELSKTIIDGYSKKRYTTFRINTLKSNKDEILKILKENNFKLINVDWCDYAFIILNKTEEDIKKLQIYKDGYIYLQSLSSMLPVLALEPKENEHILDMTASPGSKTTQIAMITKNKSCITAIEKNKIRFDRLKYNLDKQGVTCCTVMNIDALKLDDLFTFDKILLDAPCSGSGTISIYDENKMLTIENINKIKTIQLNLLRKALTILKPHQKMVYSTCSILSMENEEVINTIMKEFNIKIIPINLKNYDLPLLPTKIENTICVCPNEYFEGFFICLIEKLYVYC